MDERTLIRVLDCVSIFKEYEMMARKILLAALAIVALVATVNLAEARCRGGHCSSGCSSCGGSCDASAPMKEDKAPPSPPSPCCRQTSRNRQAPGSVRPAREKHHGNRSCQLAVPARSRLWCGPSRDNPLGHAAFPVAAALLRCRAIRLGGV